MKSNLAVKLPEGNMAPDYRGSVQELYFSRENPDWIICKTTAGGSVFDVGTIFVIPGSDLCRTALRHKIYSLLGSKEEWQEIAREINLKFAENKQYLDLLNSDILKEFIQKGAVTHHLGIIDENSGEVYQRGFPPTPSSHVLVKRYSIIKPERVNYSSHHLWDYSGYYGKDKYVIPLENIVRFGITPSSSIYRKYQKMSHEEKTSFAHSIGLREELSPWKMFSAPIVDFTTKYEPEDRNLSLQEALYICGCGGEKFKDIFRMTILGSLLVYRFFDKLGLNLWDLKWEIAKEGNNLVFVDTIDTDSIRVTAKINYQGTDFNINFNKQAMRDYYSIMHSDWVASIISAKLDAEKSGRSFHEHLEEGQKKGVYPETPQVDKNFLEIQKAKFDSLRQYIYGQVSVEETKKHFADIGKEEISYYDINNVLQSFAKLNGC